jgi:hypothetical protein
MAHHHHHVELVGENAQLPPEASNVGKAFLSVGLLSLGAVALIAIFGAAEGNKGGRLQQIIHSYLTSFTFYLSLTLGALFFVMVQHLCRAHWSVSLRRVAEFMSCNILLLGLLGAPIGWYTVASRSPPGADHAHQTSVGHEDRFVKTGGLYKWTDAGYAQHHPIVKGKTGYLNVPFWTVRILGYFLLWTVLAFWFRNLSLRQDADGDVNHSLNRESYSAPAILAFAITITLAAIDMLMSLNATWYSTMFGVYFFAGGNASFFGAIILTLMTLQRFGKLKGVVTVEHYHDLGKFLFGFVFFWGYVAFSQYMLIWYSNIPEETEFFRDRQYIGETDRFGPWMKVGLVLLFIHILIPFPGLVSRRMKRNLPALAFWAIWVLVAHFVDMYWLVMPEFSKKIGQQDKLPFQLTDVLCFVGIGCVLIWNFLRQADGRSLVAAKDPRIHDSVTFQNF